VADGILNPSRLDLFVSACEPLGIDLNYAVLYAPLSVVLARVEARRTEPEHLGALADAGVVQDLWNGFEAHDVDDRHRVDSSDRPPGLIADEIYQRCIEGNLRLTR
jgi:hypothetical protein